MAQPAADLLQVKFVVACTNLFLMLRRPPKSTHSVTRLPYSTLFLLLLL
eukprot:COSAG02_NODE_21648_length_780_cov_1.061674_1_plen_48_part_10